MAVRNGNDKHFIQVETDDELPFAPFDRTLASVLLERNIIPLALWLLGPDSETLRTQYTNSAWETALAIEYLLSVDGILAEQNLRPEIRAQISHKVPLACRWLLTVRKTDSDGLCHWDAVTWDTSVVLRAILMSIRRYTSLFANDEQEELRAAAFSAMAWLGKRFAQWDSTVKYPFGIADLSQILITSTYVFQNDIEGLRQSNFRYGNESDPTACVVLLTEELVEYIIQHRTLYHEPRNDSGASPRPIGCYWEGSFTTAETLDALVCYINTRQIKNYSHCGVSLRHGLPKLIEIAFQVCLYVEHAQAEGQWGSHLDTIRVLGSYVTCLAVFKRQFESTSLPFNSDIHTVFKALRWMCDRKQLFDDGSFLHTSFLSVFLAGTFISVHRDWEPAKRRLDALYDDIVWASPIRTTPERARRVEAEIENIKLVEALSNKDQVIQDIKRRQQLRRNTIAFAIATLLYIILFFSVGQIAGFHNLTIELHPKFGFAIKNMSDWLAYSGANATVLLGILAFIWARRR